MYFMKKIQRGERTKIRLEENRIRVSECMVHLEATELNTNTHTSPWTQLVPALLSGKCLNTDTIQVLLAQIMQTH